MTGILFFLSPEPRNLCGCLIQGSTLHRTQNRQTQMRYKQKGNQGEPWRKTNISDGRVKAVKKQSCGSGAGKSSKGGKVGSQEQTSPRQRSWLGAKKKTVVLLFILLQC